MTTERALGTTTERALGTTTERALGTTTERALGTTTERALGTTTERALGTTTERALGTTTERALGMVARSAVRFRLRRHSERSEESRVSAPVPVTTGHPFARSSHCGFMLSISATRRARVQDLTCFSRAIAVRGPATISTYTRRRIRYRLVNVEDPDRCSDVRR
jgi:hypothetical protein